MIDATPSRWGAIHWPLISVTLLIGLLGAYNIHSAAAAHDPGLYLTQLVWLALGAGVCALILMPDYRVSESLAYVIYAVSCLLLLAVIVQGKSAMGARRWIAVGPLTFQPSELAKLAVVFCLARYFSQRPRDDGFSAADLFRPLNPTRPLAVAVVVAVFWSKPWLVDPVGMLARVIRNQPAPVVGDLLWFRVALILCILGFVVGGILVLRGLEQRSKLLEPWPPGRLRLLGALLAALGLLAGFALFWTWQLPVLRDPFGVALASLHDGAGPGGPYEVVQPGYGLRLLLVFATLAYGAASFFRLRQVSDNPVDLAIAPIDLLAVPVVLVLIQPDLGTAGVIALVGMSMILAVGVRLRSLAVMGFLGACVGAVAWFGVLENYQKRRILTFIDPEHDVQGAGWNAAQSLIAVGSGRWFGKGHLNGTQTQLSFLPEQHTDFAFSVWAEEQGFMGCTLVIALYALLLVFALLIARSSRDTYGALLAVGVASIVLWQAVINIGMVIGSLPVVGITLPMFSYGGSSWLSIAAGIGVLLNVHLRRRGG